LRLPFMASLRARPRGRLQLPRPLRLFHSGGALCRGSIPTLSLPGEIRASVKMPGKPRSAGFRESVRSRALVNDILRGLIEGGVVPPIAI
jgi:hypothetical protein